MLTYPPLRGVFEGQQHALLHGRYAATWPLFPLGLLERKLRLPDKRKNYFTDAILHRRAEAGSAGLTSSSGARAARDERP